MATNNDPSAMAGWARVVQPHELDGTFRVGPSPVTTGTATSGDPFNAAGIFGGTPADTNPNGPLP